MPQLELAPIGNCTVTSLVNPAARHVWFCIPRLDGEPAFLTTILRSEAGEELPVTYFARFSAHRLSLTWEQGLWHVS